MGKTYFMAISHNIINDVMFSTELENIIITGLEEKILTKIFHSEVEIFSSELVPDSNGTAILYDIRSLLNANISGTSDFFTFEIGGVTRSVQVIKSLVRMSESAKNFLPDFFLTPLASKKTTLDRHELLSFLPFESCKVYAIMTYFNDGEISNKTVDIMADGDVQLNHLNTVNCSPMMLHNAEYGQLIQFTIHAGNRSFTYEVDNTLPTAEPAVIFSNAFGCWDTMYFTGTKETALEVARSFAYIDGAYKMYDSKDTETFKVNSGVLVGDMILLGKELAVSPLVYLMEKDGTTADKVVITDSEIKYTNDNDSLPTFDYTFRRSTVVTVFVKAVRPPKLFDRTFDITFN